MSARALVGEFDVEADTATEAPQAIAARILAACAAKRSAGPTR